MHPTAIDRSTPPSAFIYPPTHTKKTNMIQVHKLKKGPILVPMYAHVTITSLGTAAQKKAVIYHREASIYICVCADCIVLHTGGCAVYIYMCVCA